MFKMAIFWTVIAALLLISIVEGKALGTEDGDESVSVTETLSDEKTITPTTLMPNLYLIIQSDDTKTHSSVQKRSAKEIDDLETAAGTNVLRPLFVYRQQLAYRERIKNGVIRRPGIRPRF